MSNQELYQENVRVLVAEDDYLVGTMTKGLLEETGYIVVGEAANGLEAVEMTQSLHPDVVLMDIKLPHMDGIEATRRIYESCPTPVVMLTAYDTLEMVEQASAAGAGAYLVKPPNVREMERAITIAIARFGDMMELRRLNAELRAEITERKEAEARIAHLNAVLRAIRNVNQLIAREKDLDRLLQGVCESLIETRGYHNAWIALLDEAGGLVTSAESGLGEDFSALVEQLKRGELTACGQSALAQQNVVAVKDPLSACTDCPLAAKYGGRGAMTVRLEHGGKVHGLLAVSVPAGLVADEEEHSLLKEVAGDIAFALYSVELEEERRRAEEALRKSEARYRAVVEYQTDLLSRFRPDGTLTFVNEAYCRYFGKQRDELIGSNIASYVLEEDREELADYLASFGPEKQVGRIEHRSVAAGGKIRWVQWIDRPIFDERGDVIEYQSVGRDITERKQAEDALRESEEKYRTILESIEDGYYEVDLAGNLAFFNDSLCKMLGYSPDEMMGLNNREFMGDETARPVYHTFNEVYRTGKPAKAVDWALIRKDGDRRLVEISVSLIRNPTGKPTGFRGVARDVTERKRAEERMQRQERLAAVGQLAGGIAHDFNNLLTTIMLYAQIPLGKRDLPPNLARAFETILSESHSAAELVQQILDFSRRSPIELHPMDLKSFIKEAVRVLERTIPESIHVLFEPGPEEYVVNADPTRVQQVLMNLAVNARDAMPGGGELRFELSRMQLKPDEEPPVAEMPLLSSPPQAGEPALSLSKGIEGGEWVCLAVSDTGTGIPPDVLDHIFEPFFTTKPEGRGTGLGLAQVYGIVAQHEGHIGVETEMGKGTIFRVYLPAYGMEAMEQVEEASAPPRGKGETILLVEDNEKLLEGGRGLLESLGYRALAAADGRKALEVYQTAGEVDLVITDLVMPEMGGQQLVHELRQATPGLKALAITGYVMREDLEKLKDEGFLDVVYKPFDIDALARAVRRALDEDGLQIAGRIESPGYRRRD